MPTIALPHSIWAFVIILTCGCAWSFGGRTERLGAAIMLVAWVASLFVSNNRWWEPRWGVWAVDSLFLVALLVLALRSDRHWPIFAAGFHLLAIVTHAARLISPRQAAWAFVTMGVIWSYLVLFALALGVWRHWRVSQFEAGQEAGL